MWRLTVLESHYRAQGVVCSFACRCQGTQTHSDAFVNGKHGKNIVFVDVKKGR